MKTTVLIPTIALCAITTLGKAQNNTFPTAGNVGIGTTTPQYKLDVVGKTSLNGSTIIHCI